MSENIFVFTQRPELRLLLDSQFREFLGVAPVTKDSVSEFQSLLGLVSDIQLVIIDPPAEANGGGLYSVMASRGKDIKNVWVLGEEQGYKGFEYFGSQGAETLLAKIRSYFSEGNTQTIEYISISIDSFIHFKILPFDLYVRLGENKFVKRIPAHEEIDDKLLQGLKGKGVAELFFEKKFNKDFSVMLINNMINKVETSYTSDSEKIKAKSEVFRTTKEIVQSVGLPTRVIEVCQSVMDSITADITKGKDKFSNYLNSMGQGQDQNFQYRFVELTSFLATHLVGNLDEKMNMDNVKTIVFCSFFCDIALKETGFLELRTEESLKELWPEEREEILAHALKASEIVSKYKNAPKGADVIIRQHHGALDGKGFPKVCSEGISPMAKCLFASNELAFALLKNPGKDASLIVAELLKKHEGSPLHSYFMHFSIITPN